MSLISFWIQSSTFCWTTMFQEWKGQHLCWQQWFCMAAALWTTVSTSLSCLNNPAEKNKSWTTSGPGLRQQQATPTKDAERLCGHPQISTWIQSVQLTDVIEQHLMEINKYRTISMVQHQPPNEQHEDKDMMRAQQRPRLEWEDNKTGHQWGCWPQRKISSTGKEQLLRFQQK